MKALHFVLMGAVVGGVCLGTTPWKGTDAAEQTAGANWAAAMTAARGAHLQTPEAAAAAGPHELLGNRLLLVLKQAVALGPLGHLRLVVAGAPVAAQAAAQATGFPVYV